MDFDKPRLKAKDTEAEGNWTCTSSFQKKIFLAQRMRTQSSVQVTEIWFTYAQLSQAVSPFGNNCCWLDADAIFRIADRMLTCFRRFCWQNDDVLTKSWHVSDCSRHFADKLLTCWQNADIFLTKSWRADETLTCWRQRWPIADILLTCWQNADTLTKCWPLLLTFCWLHSCREGALFKLPSGFWWSR